MGYFFLMGIVSLYFGDFDPSSFPAIFGLVLVVIFYLIAGFALQSAHKKDGRSKIDWLILAGYPFLIYYLVFFDFHQSRSFFWILPGYLYFSIIVGGFLGGIILSPRLARLDRYSKEEIRETVDQGWAFVRTWRLYLIWGGLLVVLLLALVYIPLTLLIHLEEINGWRIGLFVLLFSAGIIRVNLFTYRHSIFHLRRDPELHHKFESTSS